MAIFYQIDGNNPPAGQDHTTLPIHSGAVQLDGVPRSERMWHTTEFGLREGNRTMFCYLDGADSASQQGSFRTEFHHANLSTMVNALGPPSGNPECWMNYSVYIPSNFDSFGENSSFNDRILWQLHRGPSGGGGSPAWGIEINPAKTQFLLIYKTGFPTQVAYSRALLLDQWVDFTWRTIFSTDPNIGELDFYVNGILEFPWRDRTMFFSDTSFGYTKNGCYGNTIRYGWDAYRMGVNSSLAEMRDYISGTGGSNATVEAHPRIFLPAAAQTSPPTAAPPGLTVQPHPRLFLSTDETAPGVSDIAPAIQPHPRIFMAADGGNAETGAAVTAPDETPTVPDTTPKYTLVQPDADPVYTYTAE